VLRSCIVQRCVKSLSKDTKCVVNISLDLSFEVLDDPFSRSVELEVPLMKAYTPHIRCLVDKRINAGYSSDPDSSERLQKGEERTFRVVQGIYDNGKINSVETKAFGELFGRTVASTKSVKDSAVCEDLMVPRRKGVHRNNLAVDHSLDSGRSPS